MYNPTYDKLSTVTGVPPQYTSFTDLTSNKVYELLIEPSERSYTCSAEYSKLPVMGTPYPLVTYKNSEMSLSMPSVLFWTYGNSKDLSEVLKGLVTLTQPAKETLEPPRCKLTIGQEVWARVRLSKFSYKVKMSKGGAPVMAEGSIEVLIDPEPVKPTTFVDPAATATKLSLPEQTKSAKQVRELLENDPVKAQKYNYTKGTSVVIVADDGKVSVDDKEIGYLKDILGTSTPPALNSPSLTQDKNKLKYPTPSTTTKK